MFGFSLSGFSLSEAIGRASFFFLVLTCGVSWHAESISAQERMEQVGEKLAGQADASVRHVANTVKDVIVRRDVDSLLHIAKYLVPAAVVLVILIVGYMFASFVGRVIGIAVARKVDLTLGKFLSKMVKNTIIVMVLLGTLGYFGVDVTSFAAVLAACGFAIGLALQGALSNFAAGAMLLVFRPFKVGDYIKIGSTEGTVDEIDLFTTRLNSRDNRHLILPNSSVFGSTIENVTHNTVRRVEVNVGVSYNADLAMTRRVLGQSTTCVAGALPHPEPQIYLMELGSSSVNWQVRVWCRSDSYADVRERVVAATKQSLDAAGITIPYPQLDLHVIGNALSIHTPTAKAA